tara:strand:- start:222 stop:344 length:123 start_codon:yes stop_codon:yes gene_type:complete
LLEKEDMDLEVECLQLVAETLLEEEELEVESVFQPKAILK